MPLSRGTVDATCLVRYKGALSLTASDRDRTQRRCWDCVAFCFGASELLLEKKRSF